MASKQDPLNTLEKPGGSAVRNILISGCSSGIGHCVAHGLAKRGYRVYAGVRKPADFAVLKGPGIFPLLLDLDSRTSIRAAVAATLEETGGNIFGLFNNGAYGQPGAVEDLSWEALEAQLRTNLLGWHELTRLLIPVMRRQGEGRIIQNSSILGIGALPYRGAYTCSKYALEGLSDTLRLELHGSGVQISLIEPGPIRSRFRANGLRHFEKHIDREKSVHRESYAAMLARLRVARDAAPFTLPPETVLDAVVHALESRRARPRYRVTMPTRVYAVLKRLLSTRQLDWLARRVSGGGRR